jgi:tetratricopeptide (TPR) repeat protein
LTSLKNIVAKNLKLVLIFLLASQFFACSSQKDTAMSRGMQNLTARYNYIYNSNVILENYAVELQQNYADNYTEILPVYVVPLKFNAVLDDPLATQVDSKELDQIITKAQYIISDKSYSNYIDDAYLLLGKAHFYKGNYFIATEFFDYVIKNFQQNNANYVDGLNWKARSLMQLNMLKKTIPVLDSMATAIESLKIDLSEPMATFAQMSINMVKIKDAIPYLENAIKKTSLKRNKLRWTFVLGQLYEKEKNYELALKNYTRVQKSNAGFELYFNANLSRIKMNALLSGEKINRKQQLAYLLKDDKNADYIDQIYYQIGESYYEEEDYQKAVENYQLSVSKSTKNDYQKGLSYLKIADLNFKYFNNYLKAKAYYDSTVNTLPKTYGGYDLILKKAQNLTYLTDRYTIISTQDTLQQLAKLPEAQRSQKIEALFAPKVETQPAVQNLSQNPSSPFQNTSNQNPTGNTGTFYFSNTTAISKGFVDFKKRWGNRKQEDNWRQSIRSSTQTNTQNVASLNPDGVPLDPADGTPVAKNNEALIKEFTAAVPLTPEMLAASNEKILDAYFEIASFYQQELNEIIEANRIYQIILDRFPENKYLAAIDYSLYLNYRDFDNAKSEVFKKLVLSRFPSSAYAQSILDPTFSVKQSALDAITNTEYNDVFKNYLQKDFPKVINKVDSISRTTPQNYLAAQFEYLKAIATGRTQSVDSLLTAFNHIVINYPTDQLILPLVKEHVAYINKHMEEFRKRKIALIDFDPNEPRFFSPYATVPPIPTSVITKDSTVQTAPDPVKALVPEKIATPIKPSGELFTTALSDTYYFVINVADASLTLSSSRFGIGQFNRGNYPERNLKHQLTEFDDDQLIFVGNFSNFGDAKMYADRIIPQFRQIMKMSPRIYKSFIISKENFDKLKNRDLLNQYVEFYKNNYQ